MANEIIITNQTHQNITVEEVSNAAYWVKEAPRKSHEINSGATQKVSAARIRFISQSTHYSLSSNVGGSKITIFNGLRLDTNAQTDLVTFPCYWGQIEPIVAQLKILEAEISKTGDDESKKQNLATQISVLQQRLRDITGDVDDEIMQRFGLQEGIISIVAGAGTPAAIVLSIQAVGFTTSGIAGGSFASWLMATMGGGYTSAGGLVATLQSIGAVGALGAAASVVAVATGTAAIAGIIYAVKSRKNEKNYKTPNHCDTCWELCHARFQSTQ